MNFTVRTARAGDVPLIAEVVNDYAEQGLMLHRSHADVFERLRDFQVAEVGGRIAGVTGLRIMSANLAEVYALAVAPDAGGRGIGRALVEAAAAEAERLGVRRIFSLTYERRFFERCGFEVVDRHRELPLKVWSECVRCPKNRACDEIAMVRVLAGVPEAAPPTGPPAEAVDYVVPVLSESMRRVDRAARGE